MAWLRSQAPSRSPSCSLASSPAASLPPVGWSEETSTCSWTRASLTATPPPPQQPWVLLYPTSELSWTGQRPAAYSWEELKALLRVNEPSVIRCELQPCSPLAAYQLGASRSFRAS